MTRPTGCTTTRRSTSAPGPDRLPAGRRPAHPGDRDLAVQRRAHHLARLQRAQLGDQVHRRAVQPDAAGRPAGRKARRARSARASSARATLGRPTIGEPDRRPAGGLRQRPSARQRAAAAGELCHIATAVVTTCRTTAGQGCCGARASRRPTTRTAGSRLRSGAGRLQPAAGHGPGHPDLGERGRPEHAGPRARGRSRRLRSRTFFRRGFKVYGMRPDWRAALLVPAALAGATAAQRPAPRSTAARRRRAHLRRGGRTPRIQQGRSARRAGRARPGDMQGDCRGSAGRCRRACSPPFPVEHEGLLALQTGEVDVLVGVTPSASGVWAYGVQFGPPVFYDGQGVMVHREAGIRTLAGLAGQRVWLIHRWHRGAIRCWTRRCMPAASGGGESGASPGLRHGPQRRKTTGTAWISTAISPRWAAKSARPSPSPFSAIRTVSSSTPSPASPRRSRPCGAARPSL